MPRAWLPPIGRLHRLAGRELATGCRSRRASSSPDLLCRCKICTSDFSPEDIVGCTRPFVKAIAYLKDGSQAAEDFTCTPMYPEGFTSQLVKAAIAPLKDGPCSFGSAEVQYQYKLTIPPMTHSKLYESNLRATNKASNQGGACSLGSAKVQYQYKLTIPSMTHSKLYESNPRATKKASNQNLPFVSRRSLSSKSVSLQNSSAYGPGDTNLFQQNLKSAHKKLKKELDTESLKAEFASHFRPVFVANCLLLPSKLTDHSAAYLHGQVHGLSKHWPLYLSTLDFMVRVKSCSEHQVQHLVDHIIQRRILVSEDWDHSYGNIEVLRYDPSSDTSFVRGECDAAFEALNVDGSGIAKVAMLIWKGSELIYADIIEGLECKDSVGAEVLAGLALLMKCKDLGFQKLELWSDSKRVVGVLNGSESIYMNDPNKDNCLLLRCMQTEFTELLPVFKPREVMFLTDQLLKLEGAIEYKIEKALEKWTSELKGQTLFSVTNTKWASTVIKSFAQIRMTKKQEGFVYKPDRIFFWKVEKGEKFAALSKLRDVFCPDVLYLAMDRFAEKPATLYKMVSELFPVGRVTSGSSGSMMTFTVIRNGGKSYKKPIVVVWDSCLYKEFYEQESCVVVLVEEEKGAFNESSKDQRDEYFNLPLLQWS